MAETNHLIVPIQLSALYVPEEDRSIQGQMADFSLLPYTSASLGDVNSSQAYLGETITNKPFSDNEFPLKQGIHLHWALPDGLTTGTQQRNGELEFPAVPNRWLITRKQDGIINQQWVVESDYLFPEHEDYSDVAVNIPYEGGEQPFRYLGRKMTYAQWKENGNQGKYLDKLTTVGYGEPSFAAFYPNCFSVFGYHDLLETDGKPIPAAGVEYEVVGWYSDPSSDPLRQLLQIHQGANTATRKQAVQEEFDWLLPEDFTGEGHLMCMAKLRLNAGFDHQQVPALHPRITIGNTPTEALSAALAEYLIEGSADPGQALVAIEDQLEAIQQASDLSGKSLDVAARFRQARHQSQFTAYQHSYSWTIGRSRKGNLKAENVPEELESVPSSLQVLLHEVNELQDQYDWGTALITSDREQLFADWYKYMITLYPPDRLSDDYPAVDAVRHFLEAHALPAFDARLGFVGEIEVRDSEEGHFIAADSGTSSPTSVARQLTEKLEQLQEQLTIWTTTEDTKVEAYLKRVLDPRFWEPNDPCLLLEGGGLSVSERNGRDGTLTLYPVAIDQVFDPVSYSMFQEQLPEALFEHIFEPDRQPWSPFLLDWEVQYFPYEHTSGSEDTFPKGLVTDHFEMRYGSPDLSLRGEKGSLSRRPMTYSGSSILTEESNDLLQQSIIEHMRKLKLPEAYEQETGKHWDLSLKAFREWYANGNPKPGVLVQIKALEKLQEMVCLSQSLDGLNLAMLMKKSTLSFPVDDPLNYGNPEDPKSLRGFSANRMSAAVEEVSHLAPVPWNPFHPIRSGVLKINRLRLIDTFGQTRSIDCSRIDTSYSLATSGSNYLISLPPRICHPTRMNFHLIKRNARPGTVPRAVPDEQVLGWLVPNKVEKSLMIYEESGKALGYFKARKWHEAIDSDQAVALDEISNSYLKNVVHFIQRAIAEDEPGSDADDQFLMHFIQSLEDALDHTQPEVSQQLKGVSWLIGRPIAVVRTALSLEMLGSPAVDQSWGAFEKDMGRSDRETRGYTNVKLPIRIGEYGQLNDGLIGYWIEDWRGEQQEFINDVFYCPNSDYIDTPKIESQYVKPGASEPPINVYRSLSDPPQILTVLMEPRGLLHASAGILPCKKLGLNPAAYEQSINQLETTFLAAPLLMPRNQVHLGLRSAKTLEWSWVERADFLKETGASTWKEVRAEGQISEAQFLEQWPVSPFADLLPASEALKYLISVEVGWLKPGKAATYLLMSHDQKGDSSLRDSSLEGRESDLDRWLNQQAKAIKPPVLEADYIHKNEIKEGWIKVRKTHSDAL